MNKFIQQIRECANNTKYTKWYISIIKNSKATPSSDTYTEQHHILPKSFQYFIKENINDPDNIVILDARSHFIVHLLLTKMFSDDKLMNKKMNFAFFQMKLSNRFQNKRYINSRFYSKVKRQTTEYMRLYKGEAVLYIDKNDSLYNKKYYDAIAIGFTCVMTEEYKNGRVGNMLGKKHTLETKAKMSITAKQIIHHGLLNQTSEQRKKAREKAIQTKKQKLAKNPNVYDEGRARTSKKLKEMYKSGVLSNKGKNNSRYGKVVTDMQRKEISETQQRRTNSGYTHIETYYMYVKPSLDRGLTLIEIAMNHPYYTGSKANKAYYLQQVIRKTIKQCELH